MSSGDLDLEALEDRTISDEALLKRLTCLPGLGPFSAANMLQLLGRYAAIACDSETIRHLKAHRKLSDCSSRNVLQLAGEVRAAASLLAPQQQDAQYTCVLKRLGFGA